MEPDEDVVLIRCKKIQVDRVGYQQIAYLTPSFEMLSLNPARIEDENDADIYMGVFEGLWFDFPTTFHKGDIVWDPKRPDGVCGGPFVTTGVRLYGIESDKKIGSEKTATLQICMLEDIS